MFTADQVWQAIERLAATKGLSMSALARSAGLDSTALNLSKRAKPDGTTRWLSTATLSAILQATNSSLTQFAALIEGERPADAVAEVLQSRAAILLVDDDQAFAEAAASGLRAAGYRVHATSDHTAAIDLLAGPEAIDLLITDIVMPAGLGGVALARIAQMRRPQIAVIYVTGYDIPGLENKSSCILLRKPIAIEQLLSAIEAVSQPATSSGQCG